MNAKKNIYFLLQMDLAYIRHAQCKIAIAPSLCQALKQMLCEPFRPVRWTEAFSIFTKMVLISSNRTLVNRTKPTFHGLCICELNYVICVRVCVSRCHRNCTTYQQAQSHSRATGTARPLPRSNLCQEWHERREREEDTHTHTHTGYPPILLAGDSHGNGSRNPFSTDTRTAVQIVDESRLVWAFLH